MKKAVFVYSPEQLGYKFSDTHPFNHKRLTLTMDLLKNINALDDVDIVPARVATEEELLLAHDSKYIDIVKKQDMVNYQKHNVKAMGLALKIPLFLKICMKQVHS